jgi:hypothetical protein
MSNHIFNDLVFARAQNPTELSITGGYRVFCTEDGVGDGGVKLTHEQAYLGPDGKPRHVNGNHVHQDYEPGKLPERYVRPNGTFTPEGARMVEVHASRFVGSTKPKSAPPKVAPLANDKLKPHQTLLYASYNNRSLDLATGKWVEPEVRVPPRENDLLCGVVGVDKHGRACFDHWWICSEQFFRLIMCLRLIGINHNRTAEDVCKELSSVPYFANSFKEYDALAEERAKAEAEGRPVPDKVLVMEDFFRYATRGNSFTISSAVDKVIWALIDNDLPPMEYQTLLKSYSRSRCESYTRDPTCVHLYYALLLKFVLNTEITEHNVPKNILGPQTLKWRLPENFDKIAEFVSTM